jgi:hypothetical protein
VGRRWRRGKRPGPSWDLAKFHKWARYSEVTKVNKLFVNFISDFLLTFPYLSADFLLAFLLTFAYPNKHLY